MARREVLIGGGTLALVSGPLVSALMPGMPTPCAAQPVPQTDRLGFDIMRKGALLGSHVLTFSHEANRLTVKVEVHLVYKLLGITLYHYAHHCTEVREGGQVVALDSRTDDNGTPSLLTARRDAGGLVVQATGIQRYTAPANALPATHWDQRELDGPWINTQNGKLLRPHVAPAGLEAIPAAGGRSVNARRFDLSGDVQMAMWYDRLGWAGLSFTRGGSPIRYERQA